MHFFWFICYIDVLVKKLVFVENFFFRVCCCFFTFFFFFRILLFCNCPVGKKVAFYGFVNWSKIELCSCWCWFLLSNLFCWCCFAFHAVIVVAFLLDFDLFLHVLLEVIIGCSVWRWPCSGWDWPCFGWCQPCFDIGPVLVDVVFVLVLTSVCGKDSDFTWCFVWNLVEMHPHFACGVFSFPLENIKLEKSHHRLCFDNVDRAWCYKLV